MLRSMLVPYALAASVVVSCRGTSGPDLDGEVYVLRSISGDGLPAAYAQNPLSTARVIADTMVFGDGNVGEQHAVYESANSPRWSVRTRLSYVRSQNRVEVSFHCDANALCIAPPHYIGSINNTELVIDDSRVTRVPLRFERVRP